MFKRRCRAWLLTVFGFETAVDWPVDTRVDEGRAWLLTVYGLQENKKHLSIAGSAFLIRGEDDKKNTATLSRNGWKNFFVIVQVFIPPVI